MGIAQRVRDGLAGAGGPVAHHGAPRAGQGGVLLAVQPVAGLAVPAVQIEGVGGRAGDPSVVVGKGRVAGGGLAHRLADPVHPGHIVRRDLRGVGPPPAQTGPPAPCPGRSWPS